MVINSIRGNRIMENMKRHQFEILVQNYFEKNNIAKEQSEAMKPEINSNLREQQVTHNKWIWRMNNMCSQPSPWAWWSTATAFSNTGQPISWMCLLHCLYWVCRNHHWQIHKMSYQFLTIVLTFAKNESYFSKGITFCLQYAWKYNISSIPFFF